MPVKRLLAGRHWPQQNTRKIVRGQSKNFGSDSSSIKRIGTHSGRSNGSQKIDFLQVAVGGVTRGGACSSLMIWCSSSIVLGAAPHGGSHGTSDEMTPGVDHLRTTHSEMVEGTRERRGWEGKKTNHVLVTSDTRFDCHADHLPTTRKEKINFLGNRARAFSGTGRKKEGENSIAT